LVLGLIAAGYNLLVRQPIFWRNPADRWRIALLNLLDTTVTCAVYFLLAWASVRMVTWIIDGFRSDKNKPSTHI